MSDKIQIFLAHAKEDEEEVLKLYKHLKAKGYKPWLDKKDLLPGYNWRKEIPKAIKESDIFIACFSQQSVSKQGYVQREFKMALNEYAERPPGKIYVVPLKLDECEIPDLQQMEYGINLRDIQWVDYWEQDGFEKLVRAIEHQYNNLHSPGSTTPVAKPSEKLGGNTAKSASSNNFQQDYSLPLEIFKNQKELFRYELLEKVKKEVECLLAKYLYQEVLINLEKESQPKQVRIPREDYYYQPNYLLPSETNIMDFFDKKAVSGKFLILGESGSGKTITLLEIAQSLIFRAENYISEYINPIPVNLSLSTWDNQKIEEWLVIECSKKYCVSEKNVLELIKNHQLILLFDNLDELNIKKQIKCIQSINTFLNSKYRAEYIVICSRFNEYERCCCKLQLNGAIYLKPLLKTQIEQYFADINRIDIWHDIKSDYQILDLVQKPFYLNTLVKTHKSFFNQKSNNSNLEIDHRFLLNSYIEYCLGEEHKHKYWLSWLAKRLEENKQVDFLLEKMEFSWLKTNKQKRAYKTIVGLIVGAISMPLLMIIYNQLFLIKAIPVLDPEYTNTYGELLYISMINNTVIIPGLMSIIFGIFIGFLFPEIRPVETLKFPSKELIEVITSSSIKERLLGALINNLRISNETRNFIWLLNNFTEFLGRTLIGIICPITAPIRGLIRGFKGYELSIKKRNFPNQGIYKSAFNTAIYAMIFAFILSLIGLVYGFIETFLNIESNENNLIPFVLIFWLIGFLIGGLYPGLAVIQHFTLRLILSWNNYIPCGYVHFLDEVTEKKLL